MPWAVAGAGWFVASRWGAALGRECRGGWGSNATHCKLTGDCTCTAPPRCPPSAPYPGTPAGRIFSPVCLVAVRTHVPLAPPSPRR